MAIHEGCQGVGDVDADEHLQLKGRSGTFLQVRQEVFEGSGIHLKEIISIWDYKGQLQTTR
jgi:hypothetical protein